MVKIYTAMILAILACEPAAQAVESERDPVEAHLSSREERPSSYFFVGFDDCVERLWLPNANPEQYCRERFPKAGMQVQHSARK